MALNITQEIKDQLEKEVATFNQTTLSKATYAYGITTRSKYIYLNVHHLNGPTYKIGRLTYNGDTEDMDFAVFKYSSERYDPEEFAFPGTKHLNGTIRGAMKCGLKLV